MLICSYLFCIVPYFMLFLTDAAALVAKTSLIAGSRVSAVSICLEA